MLTSAKNSRKYKNQTTRSKTSDNFYRKTKKLTENQLAIEDTKKLYQKYYENPNPLFLSQLKTPTINIFLDNYKFNDITVMTRILNKYFYFKYLVLAPYDPQKKSPKSRRENIRSPITEGEKVKLEKEKRDKEVENAHMINKITLGIGKHLTLTQNLLALSLINLEIDEKISQNISKGIIGNSSIHAISINNCKMNIEVYEILLKGLLNHEKIEYLDLQNNNLEDKYGNMVGRIIARQTYRRDQEIWLCGLRNEVPKTNDYALGLISINLNGNYLSSYSADCITTSLASDQYIRSIVLSNNQFDKESCKKFIYMLRRNMTLLNIDLRDNPGYDDNIKIRLIMKMSKNIRNLYMQFKAGVYTEDEFQNYKRFIDTSFFDLDIPDEVVEFYNNNFQKLTEGNLNNNINISGNTLKNNNQDNNINKVMSDIQEEEKEYSNSNMSKNSLSVTANSKNKNRPKNNNSKKISSFSESENKKLKEENLMLKKQILELKAENIQNKLGRNLKIPNNYNMENLKKNYKLADELFDKLNEVMTTMGNDTENINDDKKIQNIKEDEKEIKKDEIKPNEIKPNEIKPNEIKKNDIKQNEIKQNNNKQNEDNQIAKNEKEINNKIEKKEKIKEEDKNKIEEKDIKEKNGINISEKKKMEDKEENKKEDNENINNLKVDEEHEEKEDEDFDNLNDDDYAMLQHQRLYEQLKKEYEEKGIKFDIEDYMELLQHAAEQEDGENDDI